ncbi:DUF3027 domain-containing protein [Microbacterium sp. zg-Y818]|uniref:DUF3027 domain-containing protein n=1 Tax=unclassified Microbacterium TaxID=2609290 RepID=UPI00214C2F95|nr:MULTISPECIES: DUF3027 domain-containing protein [unclassified Microbacterium]MCR2799508.1 DUF3027 domain-containing protein [Microbacterium sp. zg.Y818]WIM21503.1 DUF3027 domain-containing protein [Microbacterium sp. zg-Y818]
MTSKPEPADERLLHAHDLARAALREVTPDATIGDAAGYTVEDGGVVSLRFNNRMPGYPGWFWTVSIAVVEGSDPTVLEVELLPGDGALLAPEWVPWAVRLADYQAAQAAAAAAALEAGELPDADADERDADEDDDVDDLDDLDAADFDEDGSAILHGGDLDGVDIDELDESVVVDEDDEDDEDEDDDDEDSDDEDDDDSDDEDSDDDEDDGVS